MTLKARIAPMETTQILAQIKAMAFKYFSFITENITENITKNIQISEIIRQLFSMLRGSLFTFIFWLGGLG